MPEQKERIFKREKLDELKGSLQITEQYLDILDTEIKDIIDKSVSRAKTNRRNTLLPRDL